MHQVILLSILVMKIFFKLRAKSGENVIRTYYDEPNFQINWEGETIKQTNLRTRVASVTYQENPGTTYDQASHYSYDVHGNVKTLVQEIANKTLVKRLDYDYDLVSGKVNQITYQKGNNSDKLIHKIEYDSDNRISKVFTSKDSILWDNDIKYSYYAHGLLARTVIGDREVETQNHAYTLQGWIKGVNGQNFSYALGHNNNDYSAIGTSTLLSALVATGKEIFNGNIATWASQNSTNNGVLAPIWIQQFEYDQLNRLAVANTLNAVNQFKNTYDYDPNGNITALKRFDETGVQFDDLKYNYQNSASTQKYKENTNKLRSVDDNPTFSTLKTDDIDDQDVDNYQYDETGNLIFDRADKVQNIEWTASGKVKSVTRFDGTDKYNLSFTYNSEGQRVSKTVTKAGLSTITYYVHDTHGNILATYNNTALEEQNIFGASRIGTLKNDDKYYELTDQLNNVRAVISGSGVVKSASDYYPFGVLANSFHPTESRFGYNGKERDDEGLGGGGTTYDYGLRIYNPNLAKFLSVDPLFHGFPWYTPYQFAGNKPIVSIDLDGAEDLPTNPEVAESEPNRTVQEQLSHEMAEAETNGALDVHASTACYPTAWKRIESAYQNAHGQAGTGKVPSALVKNVSWKDIKVSETSTETRSWPTASKGAATTFLLLAGNQYGHRNWSKIPVEYRGKGLAGALVHSKLATFVDNVWDGGLKAGAAVQYYTSKENYDNVRDGKAITTGYGHSVLFKEYTYGLDANGKQEITGMVVHDQYGSRTVSKDVNVPVFGANLKDIPKPETKTKGSNSSKTQKETKTKK